MPFPLIPLIGAGASILGNVLNNNAVQSANEQSQEWQEKMYGIQRKDSLADWERQNAYNSPAAQMERLKAAGLNPNLVYGSGSAIQPSAAVRASSTGSYRAQPTENTLGNVMLQVFQIMKTQAETAKIQADKDNKQAAFPGIVSDSDVKAHTIGDRIDQVHNENVLKQTIQQTELMKQGKIQADTAYTIAQNIRADMLAGQTVKESTQRIAKMISDMDINSARKAVLLQTVNNLQQDEELKKYENSLHDVFLNGGDPGKMANTVLQSLLRALTK